MPIPWRAPSRTDPLLLAYTSTPFRGLDLLAGMFPLIPRPCRLRVFSDMGTYLTGPSDSQFQALYDQCRNTPGIEHVGTLAQPELAEALRAVSILAYPCTFPETGCIAALEAMAAGCAVVASDLGALAETTAGHALLVDPGEDWSSFGARYLTALTLSWRRCCRRPASSGCGNRFVSSTKRRLGGQRAGEWADFFKSAHCLKVQNVAGCLNSETHLHKVAPLKQYPPAYGRNSPDTPRIKSPLQ